MKNWKSLMITAAALVVMSSAPDARGQSPLQPTNSAQSSPNSGTDVKSRQLAKGGRQERIAAVIGACMATAVELEKTRTMVTALESENTALKERLETEKRAAAILTELNETRKAESDALRATVTAKNETIAAKDAVIVSQDKLITALKQRKSSPWRRLGDVLIGVAVFAILK